MPPDRADRLAAVAKRKRDRALERAQTALRDLDQRGDPITFQAVARHLRAEIEQLRDRTPSAAPRGPDAERAREASLRQRNTTLLAENQRLREENAGLRDELAIAYGERRQALAD